MFDDPPKSLGTGKSLTDLINEGVLEFNINNSVYLSHFNNMIESTFRVLIEGFRWSLLKSITGNIAISDHPLTYLIPKMNYGAYGMPLGGEKCEVAFPISKYLYLIGRWGSSFEYSESAAAVEQLNLRQTIFANRQVACSNPNPSIKNLVIKYQSIGFQSKAEADVPLAL